MYAILTPLKGLTIQGSYTYDYYDKQKDSKPNFVPMYNSRRIRYIRMVWPDKHL